MNRGICCQVLSLLISIPQSNILPLVKKHSHLVHSIRSHLPQLRPMGVLAATDNTIFLMEWLLFLNIDILISKRFVIRPKLTDIRVISGLVKILSPFGRRWTYKCHWVYQVQRYIFQSRNRDLVIEIVKSCIPMGERWTAVDPKCKQ